MPSVWIEQSHLIYILPEFPKGISQRHLPEGLKDVKLGWEEVLLLNNSSKGNKRQETNFFKGDGLPLESDKLQCQGLSCLAYL